MRAKVSIFRVTMESLLKNLDLAGFKTDKLAIELQSLPNQSPSVFPMFVSKMCQEISLLMSTEESVQPVNEAGCDGHSWKMELSSLLKELSCPHLRFDH